MPQPRGAEARALFEAARARELARRGDPQSARRPPGEAPPGGSPPGYATECWTGGCHYPSGARHTAAVHDGRRCTVWDAAGPCPCTGLTGKPEQDQATEGET